MAYSVTLNADGNASLGNLRGEFVNLQPAAADYPTGGYAIVPANVGMDKILGVIPIGGQGGWVLAWNPATGKLQVFQSPAVAATPAAAAELSEVPANTDLSASAFQLLLVGL